MKSLRKTPNSAKQWIDRYNTLLAVGHANACPRVMRSELDDLLAEIVTTHDNRPAALALRQLQGGREHPAAVAQDMARLYSWIADS